VPLLAVGADCRQAGFDRLRAFGSHVAILHPGSGGMKKRWPLTGFLELAKRLKEDGRITPLLMLGEADQDLMDELNALGKPWPMLFGLSLCDVAGVLSCASLYVGNDSGVTHLAAAVGVRTVALFGPSDPAIWGPRGSHVSVCRPAHPDHVDMESLAPYDVWSEIAREQR